MVFKNIMTGVCQHLDLSVSDLNDDTVMLNIEFNNDSCIEVVWVESVSAICLTGVFAYLPGDDTPPELFETLLLSQRYGVLTDNAYFTLNREERTLLLAQNIPVDGVSSQYIANQLEQFVNTLQVWKQKYKNNDMSLDTNLTTGPQMARVPANNTIIYG